MAVFDYDPKEHEEIRRKKIDKKISKKWLVLKHCNYVMQDLEKKINILTNDMMFCNYFKEENFIFYDNKFCKKNYSLEDNENIRHLFLINEINKHGKKIIFLRLNILHHYRSYMLKNVMRDISYINKK